MQYMLSAQYWMPQQPSQKVFEQPLTPSNNGCVLLGLRLTLDCIFGDGLFGRDRRDDKDRVETSERLMKLQEGRVTPACLLSL